MSHHVVPAPADYNAPAALARSFFSRLARLVLNRARVIVTVKRMVELAATCEGLRGPMGAVASSDGEHCILPPLFNQHVFRALEE